MALDNRVGTRAGELMFRRSVAPTSDDLERLCAQSKLVRSTAEANAHSTVHPILERNRNRLRVHNLGRQSQPLPDSLLRLGHLYFVLAGQVRLYWLGDTGATVTLFVSGAGEVIGELQCGILDLPTRSHGLHVEAAHTGRNQNARLLEVPPSTVGELFQNQSFRDGVARIAVRRVLDVQDVARFRMLGDLRLAVAHSCVSPSCGHDFRYHESLSYQGARLVIEKTATLDEISHVLGVSVNTVNTWLRELEASGYICRDALRFRHTRITVIDPLAFVDALELGNLDISA